MIRPPPNSPLFPSPPLSRSPMIGGSPPRRGRLLVTPPVEVAAARLPSPSRATAPTVPAAAGTVGAVARDGDGNLAAATSTGGVTNKRPRRGGDPPIIGERERGGEGKRGEFGGGRII